jgi:hypothetical protein
MNEDLDIYKWISVFIILITSSLFIFKLIGIFGLIMISISNYKDIIFKYYFNIKNKLLPSIKYEKNLLSKQIEQEIDSDKESYEFRDNNTDKEI